VLAGLAQDLDVHRHEVPRIRRVDGQTRCVATGPGERVVAEPVVPAFPHGGDGERNERYAVGGSDHETGLLLRAPPRGTPAATGWLFGADTHNSRRPCGPLRAPSADAAAAAGWPASAAASGAVLRA
jgi:hypothetical protein